MGHVEALTKYVTHFVDQLAFSGVRQGRHFTRVPVHTAGPDIC